jgi:hypothetical protein
MVLSLVFGSDSEQDGLQGNDDYNEERTPGGEWRSESQIHELKTRLILLDQYALEEDDSEGDHIDPEAEGGRPRTLNDRMHDRILHSSLARLPYEFGEKWILRLQELFRDGYTARRLWYKRKVAAIAVAFAKGEQHEVRNAVFHAGEFDGETLDGHATYDNFMRILEGWET